MQPFKAVILAALYVGKVWSAPIAITLQGSDGSILYTLENSTSPFYVPSSVKSGPVGIYQVSYTGPEVFVPFTVLVTNETVITSDILVKTLELYMEDDVYSVGFYDGLQIISTQSSAILDASAVAYLSNLTLSYLLVDSYISGNLSSATSFVKSEITPPGPYLGKLSNDSLSLYKTYATFYDEYDTFMSGFTPNDDGSYSSIGLWQPQHYDILIPYPSKLYSALLDTDKYPLAGLRFAIKDIIDIEGIVQHGGSQAYARIYPTPKNATAPAMLDLIALGAVPIGNTKPATFAWGAWPDQNVDIPYPWNPRADRYLGLSASSHGSAAAIAAYPELDFTIGTDTGGSVRNPADRAGVYGLRPTWSVINVTGVITSAKTLDAVGFLARDPWLSNKLAKVWFGPDNPALASGSFSHPMKIIYPVEWFPVNSSAAQVLIDEWLTNVTTSLGMTIEYQNTSEIFQDIIGYNGTLQEWSTNISSVNIRDNWLALGEQFVSDYGGANGGQYPPLDISVRTPWAKSPTYTEEYYDQNVALSWEFTDFINDHVIIGNNKTCSDGLWIYQIADTGGGVPEYRDRTLDYFPAYTGAMRGASIAPFAHTVDITVPIGQIPYMSAISHVEEQLAITLSFVAHRGCDLALMAFVEACADAGYCKEVKTGRTAY
ncbi:hypothetical protein BP5796_12419 [Coleophoma crateriformis]|uniref:Uncharacterized protein n=1 Tax=Coleophoma crateriformis TaxID=565419 RepID=A0A3D8Q9L1_9HELO|nr:hypothetical protein BP5796_12419 [Coleophoma crateriformis]